MKYKTYLKTEEKIKLQNKIKKETGLKVEFHNDHLKIITDEWVEKW